MSDHRSISVFEIIKVGVGPSSSHTMGPWRAALFFIEELARKNLWQSLQRIEVILYGSLSKTGKGTVVIKPLLQDCTTIIFGSSVEANG